MSVISAQGSTGGFPVVLIVLLILVVAAVAFFFLRSKKEGTAGAQAGAPAAPLETAASDKSPEPSASVAAEPQAPAHTTTSEVEQGTDVVVKAPISGTVVPLAEVPDPAFAMGAVGAGVGIDPADNVVRAPGNGKIIMTFPTGHAVGIKLDNGVDLLIHVGLDTVNMNGEGFTVNVQKGDIVKVGDPLLTFDRAAIEAAGYSPITPVLVTNQKKFDVTGEATGAIQHGDSLYKAVKKAPAA